MHPTTQPHQRGYRQERRQSEPPSSSAGPSMASSSTHAGTTYIPLPAAAPALPPPRPVHPHSATSPIGSIPYQQRPAQGQQRPSSAYQLPNSLRPQPPLVHPSGVPTQDPLARRLVNPYEQREEATQRGEAPLVHNRRSAGATRQSFGPGDPLFSAQAADAHRSPPSQPHPPSTRAQSPVNPMALHRGALRASSTSFTRPGSQSRTANDAMSLPPHGAQGHEFDDCPGCRAEMQDVIHASLESAQKEDEKRHRSLQEQQEFQSVYAANVEENDRQRRLAQEEEQLLQQAIQESRCEAEEQSQRSRQNEELLLEESRQYAIRQREQSARLEAQMLEAATLASSEQEAQRRRELDVMQEAEQRALQLSLEEQEEEWARRESAERSLLEFLDQTSSMNRPAASSSSSAAASTSASKPPTADDLDAEYWRFAGHDEAYQLALQMQRASLADLSTNASLDSLRTRRPLPRTPEAQGNTDTARDSFLGSARKRDETPAPVHPANLYDAAEEAPPAYSEASLPRPSNPSSRPAPAARPRENPIRAHYDAAAFESLDRPALQQRSSSSSSANSQSQDHMSTKSSRLSFGGASRNSTEVLPPPTSAVESSPAPHPAPASPSIPQRGSSHSTPASKSWSTSSSSLPHEQRGQRALAGVDFGYCSLPFALKLDRSPFEPSKSASAAASSSPASTPTSTGKAFFPTSIELSKVTKKSTSDADLSSCSFFVLRAHSWKSLLRAIAWYGNSRVEAAPAEVAAASDRRSRCLLRAEIEFVTPTRVDLGYGVGEYAKAAQSTGYMPKNPAPAHVALCLSLLPMTTCKGSVSNEASAWLKSEEHQIIKRESRRLDAWYAGRGSTRRLVQLARQPPALPVVMVQIAQLLHASHTFSAACPSSGSTARHSPRDLHHAIEHHDQGFVRKQQAMLIAGFALASQPSTPSNPRLSMQASSRTSVSSDLHRPRDAEDDELGDDDDQDDEIDFNDFTLLADGSFDAQDKVLMGKRQRLKAKVKRRLAKRSSDGRVVDEDLATWITPFDLSQHG